MTKRYTMIALLVSSTPFIFAETNALIEVKLFKDWVISEERNFGHFNLAIKNTGTEPILLAKRPVNFEGGQLVTRPLPRDPVADSKQEREYQMIARRSDEFFSLSPDETYVYDNCKFLLDSELPFAKEMRFTVSIYLGKDFWLDSEPLVINGVTPDAMEDLATIKDNTRNIQDPPRKLVAVTYKNERWLYMKGTKTGIYYSVCPLSLTNKIRVEPHDDVSLFKIWDGDKSIIFNMGKIIIVEGPDENDVYGKWTRERKQRAEADNAEVRRKKAEQQ